MRPIILFLSVLLGLSNIQLTAQRYLYPVFSEVKVTSNVRYGINASILAMPITGKAVRQELFMDIYEPGEDESNTRPLIILLPSGGFIPPQLNGGCFGSKQDAGTIDLANRLARLGYVVAVADYRLGWNPLTLNEKERAFTFVNAIYRGVQDSRTAIRFFRKTVSEQGNPYRVDPQKIVLWGDGSGGYVSLASATLDSITDTHLAKLTISDPDNILIPMISQEVNGNIDGTHTGILQTPYDKFYSLSLGDTLNYPNHVSYSSDFQLGVNMGGAIVDTSWIDVNDVPFISFHVTTDAFTPCNTGMAILPHTSLLSILEVTGSCQAQKSFNRLNMNTAIIAGGPYEDAISERARSINGNMESLYLFDALDPFDVQPWFYAASLSPYGMQGTMCDTNSVVANKYLDTIVQYFAPRAYSVLSLQSTSYPLISKQELDVKIMPNPAHSEVLIQTEWDYPISHMQLLDLHGRVLEQKMNVNDHQVYLQRNALPAGIYIVKLQIKNRVIAQKLVFN